MEMHRQRDRLLLPSRRTGKPGLLKGVRAICRYCEISNKTFYNWKDEHDFPVSQLPDDRWCTSKTLIDDWLLLRGKQQREQKARQDAQTPPPRESLGDAIPVTSGVSQQIDGSAGARVDQ